MSDVPLRVWLDREGRLLRLRLARPKANVVDAQMIGAVDTALAEHGSVAGVHAVLLDAEGPNFSFGASIEEHLPEQCASMLEAIHGLIMNMVEYPAPILVAVRGHCLGGGLELALAGNLMFVAPDASLGQPEIKVGVFAPAASCLLPERIGRARAEDLLLSGRTISGTEAVAIGLANESANDPEAAALAYFDQHLAGLSASTLHYAMRAARIDLAERVRRRIREAESLYLGDLMTTRDAVEGLEAFIEKRPAKWEHR